MPSYTGSVRTAADARCMRYAATTKPSCSRNSFSVAACKECSNMLHVFTSHMHVQHSRQRDKAVQLEQFLQQGQPRKETATTACMIHASHTTKLCNPISIIDSGAPGLRTCQAHMPPTSTVPLPPPSNTVGSRSSISSSESNMLVLTISGVAPGGLGSGCASGVACHDQINSISK